MNDSYLNRKLTAILYADVAGYSRLMGSDEEGTHHKVMEMLDYASSTIKNSGGVVLRYAGDAILAEFSSAVVAVNTSIEIQTELAIKNSVFDLDKKVLIRVGINIGDVIEDRGEVFGDGVNLAARLEAAAPEGGVCISSSVHDQIVGKVDILFKDCGNESFKNINRPTHIFQWTPPVDTKINRAPDSAVGKISEKPSIAVLALRNMNNNSDLDYIGDGITEDLITALSKVRSFKVISRESTFTYKNTAKDVRDIASELGVQYILEGSVRKSGSRVRATAQLIDAVTGHHVWAERYDREMEDIFDLQDEMVQIIAAALEPEIYEAERVRIEHKTPNNLDAWELYQRGLSFMWNYENDAVSTAIDLFKQANEADPTFAPAYSYLTYSYYIKLILGYADDPEDLIKKGMEAAKKAIKYDSKDSMSYFSIGRILMMQGNQDQAIDALRKSIELNPCFAQAYHGLGMALALAGQLDESKQTTAKAVELSPRDPMLWAFTAVHAFTCILNNENEESLVWYRKTMQLPNVAGYWPHAVNAAALANLDRLDEAKQAIAMAVEAKPDLSIKFVKTNLPTKAKNGLDPYIDGLRMAGLVEG
ncbi:MAG: adenylate cyclase [Gammaproteobacteria bacterium]|jgi:adenylate cyclase